MKKAFVFTYKEVGEILMQSVYDKGELPPNSSVSFSTIFNNGNSTATIEITKLTLPLDTEKTDGIIK